MKFSYLLLTIFSTIIIYAGVEFDTGIVGTTHLNGQGCVCHNLDPDSTVHVWIEGPDTLYKGETAEFQIYLSGGPMVKGGFNVASRFSLLAATDPGTQIIADELTHNQPRVFVGDTVSWYFNYTAADSVDWDTLYSTANSVNGDGIPSNLDHWDFGANFPIRMLQITPVELSSFTADNYNGGILLKWITATEINNRGFEIQRSDFLGHQSKWEKIGYIDGKGTTTEKSFYSFADNSKLNEFVYYRLKQIDFNGSYTYSDIVKTQIQTNDFSLRQNYPNPFNPSTKIDYNISFTGKVTLIVYDISGKEVASLVNKNQQAGNYKVEFDASKFASGVYIYKLTAGSFSASKKLILLK
jgi:Secretion system C-terminal sorting domain